MTLKQRNFFLINFIDNFFQTNSNNIFLLTHTNDLSTSEIKELNFFCHQNNVETINIKSSLYKKMIKNVIVKNILAGPTRILKFTDFNSFLYFIQLKKFEKKLIPLLIYWNHYFYYYSFFYNYLINNLKNSSDFLEKLPKNLILSINSIKNVFINTLTPFHYKGLFLLLNILIKKLK